MRTHETILYLQMVTLMGSVNSSLPKISYMKALDVRNCPHKTVPTNILIFCILGLPGCLFLDGVRGPVGVRYGELRREEDQAEHIPVGGVQQEGAEPQGGDGETEQCRLSAQGIVFSHIWSGIRVHMIGFIGYTKVL